jgi:hypothetical protein
MLGEIDHKLPIKRAGPMAPMKPHKQQLLDAQNDVRNKPTEFIFEEEFDENGALFYLGSMGKRRPYTNPHLLR